MPRDTIEGQAETTENQPKPSWYIPGVIINDTMSPNLEPGYLVYGERYRRPEPGREALFTGPDAADMLVLTLDRVTRRTWYCRQANPPREIKLSRAEWQGHFIKWVCYCWEGAAEAGFPDRDLSLRAEQVPALVAPQVPTREARQ